MSCEAIFLNQLRQHGYRLTPQREMILFALHQIGRPATAEELCALVAEKSASIEPSTIYRTLDLLCSMNLATVIDTGEKQRLYELSATHTPHVHLACRKCGKISGVEVELLAPLFQRFEAQAHFLADWSNLTISGVCEECRQSDKV